MALDYELAYLLEPAAAPAGWSAAAATRPLARFWRFAQCRPFSAAQAEAFLARHTDARSDRRLGHLLPGNAGLVADFADNARPRP